ncbi:alpha-glucosidase 2 [Cucumis melo var. makuwa]|uniref:Alpha-glucosidase 2 n=1 Tax=Cucumis melo var. makuwa TaxID=1194695 RepID=A0A5A7U1E4_CUCMM|nr:alpha-glucosidase 2 [Cucumis melo var. makuwa]TYJ96480.1 alpha-glucosidase 2 [Cucumis melo var. makuwa]
MDQIAPLVEQNPKRSLHSLLVLSNLQRSAPPLRSDDAGDRRSTSPTATVTPIRPAALALRFGLGLKLGLHKRTVFFPMLVNLKVFDSLRWKLFGSAKTPIERACWLVKVVLWTGGRILSMTHLPSGIQWLQGKIEINGYEEYSCVEYRAAGCIEEYSIIE